MTGKLIKTLRRAPGVNVQRGPNNTHTHHSLDMYHTSFPHPLPLSCSSVNAATVAA